LTFFGGGLNDRNEPSNVVDIFNSSSQTWRSTTLFQSRYFLATSSFGEIVAFGGGWDGSTYSSVVDFYNVTSGIWFNAVLRQRRQFLSATSCTNKIFFGGGQYSSNSYSNFVDIFEIPPPPPPPPLSYDKLFTDVEQFEK
jgi:hypothetical protein